MSELAILAASYLGPEGYGNDLTGRQLWPSPLRESLEQGELAGLPWSALFPSDAQRFARLDELSRLGLMATELLEAGFHDWEADRRALVGVCVETCGGCLTTDLHFLQTPRPSIFTYTLPSTVIGEICIRYRFTGPVLCLLSSQAEARSALEEAVGWLEQEDATTCLCVGGEALTPETLRRLSLPRESLPCGWHASALLLGKKQGTPREYPVRSGSLAEVCRKLSIDKPTA